VGISPLAVAPASADQKETDRLSDAATVFSEIMAAPDKGIPQELLEKASCIVIVPGLKKGAFIFGPSLEKDSCLAARKRLKASGRLRERFVSKEEASAFKSADRKLTWSCW
jgi:hypothetical protein